MSRYCSIFVALMVVAVGTSLAERVCTSEQWEADVVGKIAQTIQGQFTILDVVGKAAADYKKGVTAFLQSVYMNGQFIHKYLYLSSQVMITAVAYFCL